VALALFDLDNTLIDRTGAFARWAAWYVAERRTDVTVDQLVRLDRDGFGQKEAMFAAIGALDVEAEVADYRRRYPTFVERVPAETVEALARLRAAGLAVAIVTNGPPSQATKLGPAGLEGLIDACLVSEVEGTRKPERRIFELAAERCGRPLEGWMVGDTAAADIAGAHAAGLRSIWLHRGRSWDPADPAPTAIAGSVAEATAIILAGG
jgi:HAD superfamily hydrolase (TIGR01549 family)